MAGLLGGFVTSLKQFVAYSRRYRDPVSGKYQKSLWFIKGNQVLQIEFFSGIDKMAARL